MRLIIGNKDYSSWSLARLITYAVPVETQAQAYVEQLWKPPAMLEWRPVAAAETEVIAEDETYR